MGKKSKAKTKQKKIAKMAGTVKGKKIPLAMATKIVKQAEKRGLDVKALATSVLAGVPIVGPLVAEVAEQLIPEPDVLSPLAGMPIRARGGAKGVMMIDASTGLNLGTISRKKALGVLVRRQKFRRPSKKVVFLPVGQEVRVI